MTCHLILFHGASRFWLIPISGFICFLPREIRNHLPGESGIYMLNIWFDYDGEELNFGDDFKKLCEFRHKWDDGWVCSKCGVRRADWIESDIKTTTREELY